MRSVRRWWVAVVWVLSLAAVAHWTAQAQGTPVPGVEVRFLPGPGKPGAPHGTLLGNFNGQWLPIGLDMAPIPDPNSLLPR
jgi:hypothetical protein